MDIKEHLNKAFQYISAIAVTGDAVDLMAAARKELKAAYAEIKKGETDGGQNDK